MDLSDVARYFDDTPCVDAYTDNYLFDGQLGVYTEGVRDGLATVRRILELDPTLAIPARRCIAFGGERWIVGGRNIDMFQGEVIRAKFVIHEAQGEADVYTLAEYIDEDTGSSMLGALTWTSTKAFVEEDSEEPNRLVLYVSQSEDVNAHQLVELGGKTYIVKESYATTAGFLAAIVEELDEPVRDTATGEGAYDWVTETHGPGDTFDVVRLRWQTDFEYLSLMTPKFERGDLQLATLNTQEVENGSTLTLSDGDWQVIGTQDRHGVRYIHVRRLA